MRVLLVDDEPLALDRLRTFFGDIEGVEVVGVAADGNEALEQIVRLTPDLVIMDIQMPGRNGLRAAADIDVEPRPELVFVTAHEHYAPDAFEVDAADYLLKPVRFDRLRQAVGRARLRRKMRDSVEQAEAAPGGGRIAARQAARCRRWRKTASGCRSATASGACRSSRSTGSRRRATMCCSTPRCAAIC